MIVLRGPLPEPYGALPVDPDCTADGLISSPLVFYAASQGTLARIPRSSIT